VDYYYHLLSREQSGKATVGYHVEASDRIVPAWQNPRVGDIIADGPPETAHYVVRHVEPNRAFVTFTDTHLPYLLPARLRDDPRPGVFGEVSDGMLLTEPGKTRPVHRMRMTCGPWPFRAYFVPIVLIWGDWITERNFLRGVKRRAEASSRATESVRPLPLGERIKTRIEHEVDTRSVGLAANLIRLTKGRIARLWRRRVLLLTTRGRRSGKERTVPLQFFPDGAGDMIVVAANSGLPEPPGWYFNLTADPLVRVEGRTLQVRAEELSKDEAVAFWSRLLQVAPDYARYPRRTSRRIPLVRLVPIGSGEGASRRNRLMPRVVGRLKGARKENHDSIGFGCIRNPLRLDAGSCRGSRGDVA
jgi:deazaflavin-dependent oxidoreductase (nitroreductase family)